MKVRRMSAVCVVTASLLIGLTAQGGNGPVGTTGCSAWYDASSIDPVGISGDKLTVWNDLSGSGNDAAQATTDLQATVVNNALNGKPVVLFDGAGDAYSFPEISDIQTVFWVLRETDFNKTDAHFFLGHSEFFDFHRGDDSRKIWSSLYGKAKDGDTYVNGAPVADASNEVLPLCNYTLVSLVTTNQLAANSITLDRGTALRSWQGEIAEIIIYNAELDDADRQAVENYLTTKWFDAANAAPQSAVTLPADGSSFVVGDTVTFSGTGTDAEDGSLSGSQLRWYSHIDGFLGTGASLDVSTLAPGNHTIELISVDSKGVSGSAIIAVNVGVAGGGFGPENTPNCVLWLDASDMDPYGINADSTITWWKDKSGLTNTATQFEATFQAKLVPAEQNGLDVVRFSAPTQTYGFPDQDYIRTVFWVVREDHHDDLHFFLGHVPTAQTSYHHFHRGGNGYIWANDWSCSENIKNGDTFLDGASVDGTTTAFPIDGKFHMLSLVTTGPVRANTLSKDRYITENRSWVGDIAEVIIYDRALTTAERESVETYLQDKWFGETQPVSAYDTWLAEYSLGSLTNYNDDADLDLLDNLAEFSLGGNPEDPSDTGHPVVLGMEEDNGTNYFIYTHVARKDAQVEGLNYYLSRTTSLTVAGDWNTNGFEYVGTGEFDSDYYSVTNRLSIDDDPHQCIKLNMEMTP